MVFQQSAAGWPLSCFSPWATWWVSAGRKQPSLSKPSYSFCPRCQKAFSWLWKGEDSTFSYRMFSQCWVQHGQSSCIGHLHLSFPRATPLPLVPILHTAWLMRAKQIAAVTYFQPPFSRKLSHQKLSMSSVQPQKSRQDRNVRCQIAGSLLWMSARGWQVLEWIGPIRRCRKQDTNFTDCLGKSCTKKWLLLQADLHGHNKHFALHKLHAQLTFNTVEVAAMEVI